MQGNMVRKYRFVSKLLCKQLVLVAESSEVDDSAILLSPDSNDGRLPPVSRVAGNVGRCGSHFCILFLPIPTLRRKHRKKKEGLGEGLIWKGTRRELGAQRGYKRWP